MLTLLYLLKQNINGILKEKALIRMERRYQSSQGSQKADQPIREEKEHGRTISLIKCEL